MFLRRVFSLLRAGGLYIIYSSGLKVWVLHVQDSFRLPPVILAVVQYILSRQLLSRKSLFWCFARSLARDSPHLFTTTSLFKTDFPYPYFRCRKGGYFRLRTLANYLAFFLPYPGHRMQTSVGFHSVGDPFGLLSLSPEWGYRVQIAWPIFFPSSMAGRSWPTFFISLLTVNLWRPANSNTECSRNSLFLFSQ